MKTTQIISMPMIDDGLAIYLHVRTCNDDEENHLFVIIFNINT